MEADTKMRRHINPSIQRLSLPPRRHPLRPCDPLSRAFQFLHPNRLPLNPATLSSSLLRSCTLSSRLLLGLQIHAHLLKTSLATYLSVANALLSLYFRLHPCPAAARKVFDELPHRDPVAWTTMVSLHIHAGAPHGSVQVFKEMQEAGVAPTGFALSAAIKACAAGRYGHTGRCFHGMVLRLGFRSSCVISSALIDMYGRNCSMEESIRVFREMGTLDLICWTSTISAYSRNGRFEEALCLFHEIPKIDRLVLDESTIGTLLTVLGNLRRLKQGKEVHGMMVSCGLRANVIVESSLVDMYGKCGSLLDSRKVFDRMDMKNAVSWCTLLGGYCQNGEYEATLEIFREMDEADENYSFGMVLRACAGMGAVKHGREVHCQFVRRGCKRSVVVESALVDLYAKCGFVDYAYRVFQRMEEKNLITWNTMIFGLAKNGRGQETVRVLDNMIKDGISPDNVSFLGVLFACSHSGLLEKGKMYFQMMSEDYGIEAGVEHCNCMVDLLGRKGLLAEAEELISHCSFRDSASLWANLLGACSTYRSYAVAEISERIAKRMIELDPNHHLSYVLLGNIYKALGRWDDAAEVGKLMRERGVKKKPGRSWIDGKSNIDYFLGLLS